MDSYGILNLILDSNATLLVSFKGYKNVEGSVAFNGEINILSKEVTKQWDDIVVVGYGSQEKCEVVYYIPQIDERGIRV